MSDDGRSHTFTGDLESDLHVPSPYDTLIRIIDIIMTFQRQAQEVFTNQGRAMNWKNARIFATNKWGYLINNVLWM
jgi:hypothetical protein